MTRLTLRCSQRLTAVVFLCALLTGTDARGEARGQACFPTLAECPVIGCAAAGSADALVNSTKHRIPSGRTPVKLTVDDFLVLQDRAAAALGEEKAEKADLNEADRAKLRALKLDSNAEVAEGDLAQVSGFIIGLPTRPKASGPESVNCRLKGTANNDFHIPIAADADSTEFEGIVVEMIPQARNSGWTVKKLKRIAKEQRPVVVRGQLFYDNKHRVNDDPDDVLGGEPKRASLWEIHPVTEFFVCIAVNKKCNVDRLNTKQWVRLENLKN